MTTATDSMTATRTVLPNGDIETITTATVPADWGAAIRDSAALCVVLGVLFAAEVALGWTDAGLAITAIGVAAVANTSGHIAGQRHRGNVTLTLTTKPVEQ